MACRASAIAAARRRRNGSDERTAASRLRVAAWLFVCCAMIFLMVVIGGITRLTLSGLSITEWQPVTGIVPPLSAADWAGGIRQIPADPAIQTAERRDEPRRVQDDLPVGIHPPPVGPADRVRLPAAVRLFPGAPADPAPPGLPLAGIFALGAAQGALGWYMVESGLADRVEVSQYRLTAHLALALAIYAATLWTGAGAVALA